MMLGEDQHAALVAALRSQPQMPQYAPSPSAQSIMENGKMLAKGYQNIKEAGKNDTQQYVDEFGPYDSQMVNSLGSDADKGNFMQGLQNKWSNAQTKIGGLFGGAGG
jgi:hypothetical protein